MTGTTLKQYIDAIPPLIPNSLSELSGAGSLASMNSVDLGSAAVTGILATARFPALSGDATNAAGTTALTIGANKVTYGKIQQESASTLLGNPTGSAASPQEIALGAGLAFLSGALVTTGTPVVEVTGTAATMAPNTVYIPNNASPVTLTFPAAFNQGDFFLVLGKGAGGWKVAQNAGQTTRGSLSTTTGTAGSISSSSRYDNCAFRGITANTELEATARNGSLVVA